LLGDGTLFVPVIDRRLAWKSLEIKLVHFVFALGIKGGVRPYNLVQAIITDSSSVVHGPRRRSVGFGTCGTYR
jgi:hypothetical protein